LQTDGPVTMLSSKVCHYYYTKK